jgi:class 3 adenylate cyclase
MPRQVQNKAVLFADVSDSSALYQKLGDTAAHNIVHACIGTLTGLLPKYEGSLVKTLGDAIFCVFPNADLAVRAAGEMQSTISTSRPGNHAVSIHIGVAYGPVLLEEADVFGDTVNVAAYLTKVAMHEQILTTEATETALAPELKTSVRPIFRTVLKGAAQESKVFQVLWRTDSAEMTEVNLSEGKVIPGDTGSLRVSLEGQRVLLNQWRRAMRIGRSRDCEIVVGDRFASREHLTIRLMRTRFYLIDHSINGTFVTFQGGEEVHVLRGELPLDRSGQLTVGRSHTEGAPEIVAFEYDRRSLYRI